MMIMIMVMILIMMLMIIIANNNVSGIHNENQNGIVRDRKSVV